MKIAIDFDGTIVEHAYPEIGKPLLFAFETLRELQKRKCQLILWTFRTGKELEDALEFCKNNGIEFYAVNNNYPEEKPENGMGRKIDADIYIDDKNLGGFPGWSEVWKMLSTLFDEEEKSDFTSYLEPKKSFLGRLFKKRI